jgi:hypothetical protein
MRKTFANVSLNLLFYIFLLFYNIENIFLQLQEKR